MVEFESKNKDKGELEKSQVKSAVPKAGIDGYVYIGTTSNNIIISLVVNGNVIGWSSGGKVGVRNASKRGTPYVGQLVGNDIVNIACNKKVSRVHIIVSGPGAGRESAIRAISACEKIEILSISDRTPISHGGCRKEKRRRV